MKKIFTLLIVSFFSMSVMAFDGTRLSISSLSTSKELKIEIDGRKFSMKNNSITVGYMGEGYHQVKIFREGKKNGYGFGRKDEVVYNGSVTLRRGFHTDITINRFGKVMIDERRIDRNDDWYQEEDDDYDYNDNGYDNGNGGWNGGYGNYVVIRHNNGTQTLYAHLSSLSVGVGESVGQGETIGGMGNTGKSTGTHLHFEVRGGRNPF